MIDYIFSDSFCVIRQIDNTDRAIYADMSMYYCEMPIRWARKAAELLNNGNYKGGLHMIDMVVERGTK